MRRRGLQSDQMKLLLIIGTAVITIISIIVIVFIAYSPEIRVVKEFYEHEQKQEFWNSYELFHPHMQEQFSRSRYIDQRSHIFVSHFGVETYDLDIGRSKKINEWRMSEAHEPLTDVYEIPVTKTYQGDFGEFSIQQNTYAVKEEGEWYILWDYNYD